VAASCEQQLLVANSIRGTSRDRSVAESGNNIEAVTLCQSFADTQLVIN
jgi:hypothetical protein